MRPIRRFRIIAFFACGSALEIQAATGAEPAEPASLEPSVDWPAFMDRHDLIWDRMPDRWETAPFLGNGLVGTMVYLGDAPNEVRFLVSRNDVGRVDYPGNGHIPMRTVIGWLTLETVGSIVAEESSCRLDLWNAEARGEIVTTAGKIGWRAFAPNGESGVVVELEPSDGEAGCRWGSDFVAGEGSASMERKGAVSVYEVEDRAHHPRSDLESGGFAVAWNEMKRPDGRTRFVWAIGASPVNRNFWEVTPSSQSARQEALESLYALSASAPAELERAHRAWWHDFYPKSFFSLSNHELETYYWIQIYKLGCMARADGPMIDNHGVWSPMGVYGFSTWDYNVQSSYRLYATANHLELGEPLIRFLDRSFNEETMWNERYGELRAGMRQQTFLRYRFFDTDHWEHGRHNRTDGPGKYLWGLHNYWRHYRFTGDDALLEPLLLKLEGGINAFVGGMRRGEDGTLHIRYGANWESHRLLEDPAGLIFVIQWALDAAVEIGERIGADAEKIERWRKLSGQIAPAPVGPYPNGKRGIYLGIDQPPVRHRHWTHLFHVFPFRMHEEMEGVPLKTTLASVDYWARLAAGLDGRNGRAFAPAAAIQLYSTLAQPKPIEELIDVFLYKNAYRGPTVWPSTLYREYGPVVETPLFFADALQSFALQSWDDEIRIFPSMPATVPNASFRDFRAEGGFLVSAQRSEGKTDFIRIRSLHGQDCIVRVEMADPVAADDGELEALGDSRYRIRLKAGESIVLRSASYEGSADVASVKKTRGSPNSFGLNERFLEPRPFIRRYLDNPYDSSMWSDVE